MSASQFLRDSMRQVMGGSMGSRVLRLLRATLGVLALWLAAGSAPAWAYCSGSTTASGYSPATVNTNVGQGVGSVIARLHVVVSVNCTEDGLSGNKDRISWLLTYTPGTASSGTSTFDTSLPGIGYRLFYNGTQMLPNTARLNGGGYFGTRNAEGCSNVPGVPSTFSGSFSFDIELVQTSATPLQPGNFNDTLLSFGYEAEKASGGVTCASVKNPANAQLGRTNGQKLTFVPPSCKMTAASANQVVTLPTILSKDLPAVGSTAGQTAFSFMLEECAVNTLVSMQMSGPATSGAGPDILDNTSGTATGVGVKLAWNGQSALNNTLALGSVGNSANFTVPMTASYYRTGEMVGGTVETQAVVTMSYQ